MLTFATRLLCALGSCTILVIVCQLFVLLLYPLLSPRFSNKVVTAPNASVVRVFSFIKVVLPSSRVEWAAVIESLFLGLAVSTLVADALFHLLPEALLSTAIELPGSSRSRSSRVLELGFWAIGGMLLVSVVERVVHSNLSFSFICALCSRRHSEAKNRKLRKTCESGSYSEEQEHVELRYSSTSAVPLPLQKIQRKNSEASSKSTEDGLQRPPNQESQIHPHSHHRHRHRPSSCHHGFSNLITDDEELYTSSSSRDQIIRPREEERKVEAPQRQPGSAESITATRSTAEMKGDIKCRSEQHGRHHLTGSHVLRRPFSMKKASSVESDEQRVDLVTDYPDLDDPDADLTSMTLYDKDDDEWIRVTTVQPSPAATPGGSMNPSTLLDMHEEQERTECCCTGRSPRKTTRKHSFRGTAFASETSASSTGDQPPQHTTKHSLRSTAWANLIAELLHNCVDGIAIGIAYSSGPLRMGIATSIAIFAHEVPSQIADFVILLRGGFKPTVAYLLNFAVAFGIHVGTLAGLFGTTEVYRPQLQMLAAGNFLCLSLSLILPQLQELIGGLHEHRISIAQSRRLALVGSSGLIAGVALISLLSALTEK